MYVSMNSTIFIKTTTREPLKHIGIKGQTYDELINQLVDVKSAFQHYVHVQPHTAMLDSNSIGNQSETGG